LSSNGAQIIEYDYRRQKRKVELVLSEDTADYATFLKSRDWDVVIFHAYEASLLRALPNLRHMRGKKILVSHGYGALIWEGGPEFPWGLASLLRRAMRSIKMIFWMRYFDRIVYLSEQSDFLGFYDHLIAKITGYKGRRVIPNGIDLAERGNPDSNFRRSHGIPEDAFMLLCVANYSPRKDQGYAARAFRKAAVPGAILVFIGSEFNEHSSRFRTEDEALSPTFQPGNIIWLEKQTRESTLDSHATCDAFLLSAYHEAQPISLLEAMRESKPWIARMAGCIARMEGGICVKTEDEMASSIRLLAKDDNLRERLGKEGFQAVVTRYNRESYIESYRKLVEELV
jgi:glycosyltransferase involved in cell wall biosynthesis